MQEEAKAVSDWETFPDELNEIDLEKAELTPIQKAALVRSYVGTYYRLLFESFPKLSPEEFEEGLAKVDSTLDWDAADYLLVIVAGWLWAKEGVVEANGHRQQHWSVLCSPDGNKNGLLGLFKTYPSGVIGIDGILDELQKESRFKLKFGERTLAQVEDYLAAQLEKREIVRNPTKYYDEDGKELYKPEDGWPSVYLVLKDWLRWNKAKPEQRWLDKVVNLYRQGLEGDMFKKEYEIVGQALVNIKLLTGENQLITW